MQTGKFVISLDFELLWGELDLPEKEAYKKNILGGRKAIPEILYLFERYGIHATWAMVGLASLESKEQVKKYEPGLKPKFENIACSAYHHFENVGNTEEDDPYSFGASLVKEILRVKNQEIGTHTFAHYYCNENGADTDSFREDIRASVAVMKEVYGVDVVSLVFPRNQAKDEFVEAAAKEGILCWRGNSKGYKVSGNRLMGYAMKAIRLLDSYLPVCGHQCSDVIEKNNGISCCRASRFFRPYSKRLKMFEKLKVWRIKRQMLYAAKKRMMFHLWWHPHNFGENTGIMLMQLEELLKYYNYLYEKYGFESYNMKECLL